MRLWGFWLDMWSLDGTARWGNSDREAANAFWGLTGNWLLCKSLQKGPAEKDKIRQMSCRVPCRLLSLHCLWWWEQLSRRNCSKQPDFQHEWFVVSTWILKLIQRMCSFSQPRSLHSAVEASWLPREAWAHLAPRELHRGHRCMVHWLHLCRAVGHAWGKQNGGRGEWFKLEMFELMLAWIEIITKASVS